jgi:hypothetical protein
MPERLLVAALLLGALWLVRRSLMPAPQAARPHASAAPRCGGCTGCGETRTQRCAAEPRP